MLKIWPVPIVLQRRKKISFAPAPGVYKVLCKGGSRRHIAAAVAVALAALITSLRGEEVG
jgi:hypothetical protein